MADERYAMFKNFMHNELGVTKDDIKRWTQESVKQVAENYVEKQFNNDTFKEFIMREAIVNPNARVFVKDIQMGIAQIIASKISVELK